ncbi:armadillo-type protein [Globomyces pollinis-pini]|nr:armadillo-type protein [Globomyces pollinis-pini]
MRLVLDPRISNGDFINKTLIACREAFGKNDPSQLPLDLLDALIFFLRFKKITSQDRDSCIQFAASLLLIRNQKLRIIAFEIILSLNPTEEFILKFLEDSNCRIRDMAIQHGIGLNFKDHRKWKAVIFKLLQDENESIRLYSLRSMWILHNETMSSEFNLDETFLRLCDAVNDPNPMIRKNACSLMGTFQNASINMLLQTLSKKMYVSTGNDLGTEKRIKLVDSSDFEFDEANVVISATYGAFIHGTEDEFMLVRSAAIDAMYEIGVVSNEFAIKALGFLVDMFNDEDPAVRVKAVHSIAQLNKISTLTLTDDTVSSVTLILLDKDPVVRQLSCKMLRGLRFQTTQILEEIVKVLIKGISSHPEDEEHIMLALSGIGRNHTSFIVQLIPKLFLLNVEFLPKEFKIDDKNHLSHLVLVFNSVYENENILKSLPTYVLQRYSYVREKYPAVIPDIAKLLSVNNLTNIIAPDIFNNSKSQGTVIGLVKTVLLDVALKLDSGVLNSKEIVQCEIRY